jgi:hypothetical protein
VFRQPLLLLTCCGVMPVKLNMPICCVMKDQSLSGQRFSSAACSSDLTPAMRPAIIAICTQHSTAGHSTTRLKQQRQWVV